MPSRWSISCWITRASSPSASTSDLLADRVARTRAHARWTLHLDMHAGDAQAALFGALELLAAPLDHGIHHRRDRIVGVGAVDEHAVQDSHLGGGQADAERVAHQLAHALDLAPQRVIEALDRDRAGAQHGIAQLAHVRQRRVAAGARLLVELLDGGRILLPGSISRSTTSASSSSLYTRPVY